MRKNHVLGDARSTPQRPIVTRAVRQDGRDNYQLVQGMGF